MRGREGVRYENGGTNYVCAGERWVNREGLLNKMRVQVREVVR